MTETFAREGCPCDQCNEARYQARMAAMEDPNKEEGSTMSEAIVEMTAQDVPTDERYAKLKERIIVENGTVKVRLNGNQPQLASVGSLTMATEVDSLTDWQITAMEELLEANRVIQSHYDMRLKANQETAELRRTVMDEVNAMWEGHSGHMNIDDVNAALDRMGLDPLESEYEFTVTYYVERQVTVTVEARDEDGARYQAINQVQNEHISYGESAYDDDSWDIEIA